jgi:hypothetical protein
MIDARLSAEEWLIVRSLGEEDGGSGKDLRIGRP